MKTLTLINWTQKRHSASKRQIAWKPPVGRWQEKPFYFFDEWESAPADCLYHQMGKLLEKARRRFRDHTKQGVFESSGTIIIDGQKYASMMIVGHTARSYDCDPHYFMRIKAQRPAA